MQNTPVHSEKAIIDKFFKKPIKREDVYLGIGDDAAILNISPQRQLVLSTDTLVENTHFPAMIAPYDLGYRSLAVNLSDIAAMGAMPAWVMLSLTLPGLDENWLKQFCQGFFTLADQHQLSLIGGNLSRGPLSITIQIAGWVKTGRALTRSGAKAGDIIAVTGQFGNAKAGRQWLQQPKDSYLPSEQAMIDAFLRPKPLVNLGLMLAHFASSCIDVSDGLIADLQQLLQASNSGATINVDKIPVVKTLPLATAITAGDDYQLCFTIAKTQMQQLLPQHHYTTIGKVEKQPGLRLLKNNKPWSLQQTGYQHFSNGPCYHQEK